MYKEKYRSLVRVLEVSDNYVHVYVPSALDLPYCSVHKRHFTEEELNIIEEGYRFFMYYTLDAEYQDEVAFDDIEIDITKTLEAQRRTSNAMRNDWIEQSRTQIENYIVDNVKNIVVVE